MNIEPIKKRRWVKYFLVIIFVVVILLTLGRPVLYYGLSRIFRDIPPPDDSGYVLKEIHVAKTDNAYYDLASASSSSPVSSDDEQIVFHNYIKYLSGELPLDTEKISSVTSLFTETFSYLESGSQRTTYQYPLFENPNAITYQAPLPPLNQIKKISTLYAIKTLVRYHEGDISGSINDAFVLVRIGSLMKKAQNVSYIEVLVGTSITDLGLDILEKIHNDTRTTSIQQGVISDSIKQYGGIRSGAVQAMKFEYMVAKDSMNKAINQARQGSTDLPFRTNEYLFQPNRTTQYFMVQAKDQITVMAAPCNETDIKVEGISPPDSYLPVFPTAFVPNAIGKMLADVRNVQNGGYRNKICTQDERIARLGSFVIESDEIQTDKNDAGTGIDNDIESRPKVTLSDYKTWIYYNAKYGFSINLPDFVDPTNIVEDDNQILVNVHNYLGDLSTATIKVFTIYPVPVDYFKREYFLQENIYSETEKTLIPRDKVFPNDYSTWMYFGENDKYVFLISNGQDCAQGEWCTLSDLLDDITKTFSVSEHSGFIETGTIESPSSGLDVRPGYNYKDDSLDVR